MDAIRITDYTVTDIAIANLPRPDEPTQRRLHQQIADQLERDLWAAILGGFPEPQPSVLRPAPRHSWRGVIDIHQTT